MGNGWSSCLSENIECNTGMGNCLCKGLSCSCGVVGTTPEQTPAGEKRAIPGSPIETAVKHRLAVLETQMITEILGRIGNPDLTDPRHSFSLRESPTPSYAITVPCTPMVPEEKSDL